MLPPRILGWLGAVQDTAGLRLNGAPAPACISRRPRDTFVRHPKYSTQNCITDNLVELEPYDLLNLRAHNHELACFSCPLLLAKVYQDIVV